MVQITLKESIPCVIQAYPYLHLFRSFITSLSLYFLVFFKSFNNIQHQNIHLDDILVAKITNLELATLFRADQARANIAIRGTKGHVAPEWFQNLGITAKVHVHNFGVPLLEVVCCCRKLVEPQLENAEAIILTNWVNACYRNGSLGALVEGDEEAFFDMKRMERFVMWPFGVSKRSHP